MIGFSADSVLKSSNKIDIFIKFPKTEIFHILAPFNVALRKKF